MENLKDYSNYIFAAYAIASLFLIGLGFHISIKYFLIKSKLEKHQKSNEKST